MAYDFYDYKYIYKTPGSGQFTEGGNQGSNWQVAQAEYNAYAGYTTVFGKEPELTEWQKAANVFKSAGGDTAGYNYLTMLKTESAITPAMSDATSKINDLNAKAALAVAEAQLTLANQAKSDVSMPRAANNPSVIDSIGGLPIGLTTQLLGGSPSKAPVIIMALMAAAALYFFRKTVFGWFR